MKSTTLLPLGMAMLCAIASKAQQDSNRIEPIIIEENRLSIPLPQMARTVHLLDSISLHQAPVQNLNDALYFVPGLDVRARGPQGVQADLSILGGTFDQSLVLLNGMKLSDPQTGHHLLNLPLSIDNIARVEVVSGAASRVFGPNAFAGAVNIVSRIPNEKYIGINGYAGEHNLAGITGILSLPGKKYGQYLSVSLDATEGYRPNTDFTRGNAFYQSELRTGIGKFTLLGGYTAQQFGANSFYTDYFPEQWEKTNTGFAALGLESNIGQLTLKPRVYWRRNVDRFRLKRQDPSFYENLHTSDVFAAEVHSSYKSKLGTSGLGVEFRHEALESTNLGERDRTTVGVFAEHRMLFFEKLFLTPGVYFNWFSNVGAQFYPGLDLGYEVVRGLVAYGTVGRSFRIPTFTDLYYSDPANLGNANLKPESAWTYEGGLRYTLGAFQASANYFMRDSKNAIDWVREADTLQWQPQNFTAIQTSGVEVKVGVEITHIGNWQQPLRVNVSYNYLQSDFNTEAGLNSRYAIDHLRHQIIGTLDHGIFKGLRHSLRARWCQRMDTDAYFVLDSRVTYALKELSFYIEASNLLNTEYRETRYVPMPGRWIRVGFAGRFGL